MQKDNKIITFENVEILPGSFRNFSGAPDKFNSRGGKRYFHLVLTEEEAEILNAEGWNVKRTNPRDEEELGVPFVKVLVNFDSDWPPTVWAGAGRNMKRLNEVSVAMLDRADIISVDLEINARPYETPDRKGVTGYLRTMYANISENRFAQKYTLVEDDEVPFGE